MTGVTGQLGGALLPLLRGHTVLAPDRAQFDLTRVGQIPGILDRLAPDIIVNPAAYTAVDRAEDEPELAFTVNAEAPGIMASWAAPRSVPLMHFSTDYVFDGSGARPWHEDDVPNPASAYGRSKLAGERAVRACAGAFLIVRTSWIYAATGANFLNAILRRAREQDEIRVVSDQIGAPTPARLIAEVVSSMLGTDVRLFRDRCSAADGVIHLAASGATSRHGFATAIISGLKSRGARLAVKDIRAVTTGEYPARAARPLNSRLDLTRLRRIFGLTPSSWMDALETELDKVVEKTVLP